MLRRSDLRTRRMAGVPPANQLLRLSGEAASENNIPASLDLVADLA